MKKIVESFGVVGSVLWLTMVSVMGSVWGTWILAAVFRWSHWKETLLVVAFSSAIVTPLLSWLFFSSLQELVEQQMEWKRLAMQDGLTGIHNRRFFTEFAERELRHLETIQASSALLLLDVDHFKRINDTYGHQAGDEVLQTISRICQKSVRKSDLVGRLGGEEFAIFLPCTTLAEAMTLAKRLRDRLDAQLVTSGGVPIRFSASIGVAESQSGRGLNPLLREADRALYEAKRNGRNRVEAFLVPALTTC